MTTIYAAPTITGFVPDGGPVAMFGSPGTELRPMPVLQAMQAGADTVVLKPGTYRGADSMVNWVGNDTAPRVIEARDAWVDGQFVNAPFRMVGCTGKTLTGTLNVYDGAHQPAGFHECVRCCIVGLGAWNNPVPDKAVRTNDMVIGLNLCDDMNFVNCFGFGYGRKTFQNYQSIRTRLDSCWFRFDDWAPGGNTMAIAHSYRSYDCTVTNCIATCEGSWDNDVTPLSEFNAAHLIAVDYFDVEGGRGTWERLGDPDRPREATRWLIEKTLVYGPPSSRVGGQGIRSRDQSGNVIRDVNVVLDAEGSWTKSLNLVLSPDGELNSLSVVNIGAGQWAKNDWAESMLGHGVNAETLPKLLPETVARINEATDRSHWRNARWMGNAGTGY